MDDSNYSITKRQMFRTKREVFVTLVFIWYCAGVLAFSTPNQKILKQSLGTSSSSSSLTAKRFGNYHQRKRGIPPRSSLQMICQDQKEFELNVGHAMDVLRDDYSVILTQNPDFSIYDQNLELIDPSGVHLAGVKNYRAAFSLLHAVVGIFYCPDTSQLTYRMCYDKARQNVRISWNAEVIPKTIFGGQKSTLYVDGISVYEFSKSSGNITQHRIERLVINDTPIAPEDGMLATLRGHAVKSKVDGIPVFNTNVDIFDKTIHQDYHLLPFQQFNPTEPRSVLFNNDKKDKDRGLASTSTSTSTQLSASSDSTSADYGDELERKNAARKKFNLPPLTPEEFAELQEQVSQLDAQQQQRAASAAAEMAAKKKKEEGGGIFKKLFGNALEDTCESNYDCQRPEVCCDFGFKKMCCTSGMRILDGPQSRRGQLAEVPVIANPGPNYPDFEPPQRY